MEDVWLFQVFDAFHVRGNGYILLPGVPREDPKVAVGDTVELRGGEGPPRRAVVKGVGTFARAETHMPLLVELEPTEKPQILLADVFRVGSATSSP